MPVQLSPGDIVQATNLTGRPVTIGYNSKSYKLTPGKPSFIPVEAAILWFGDPRSTQKVQSFKDEAGAAVFIPDRAAEVRRLSVKYGHQTGDLIEYLRGVSGTLVPRVKLTTLDGDEIPTVLDDPEGDQVIQASTTVAEQTDLRSVIDAQQRQINFLLGKLGLSGGDPLSPPQKQFSADVSDLPEDESHLHGGPVAQSNTGPEIPPDFGDSDIPGSFDLKNLP